MFRPDPAPLASPAAIRLPVAVIGGGLTGLSAAWALSRAGVSVRLFEATRRLGGVVQTQEGDGWLSETGPNTIQVNTLTTARLIEDLGLSAQQIGASPAASKRYLVRKGRLVAAPNSALGFLTTPLLSPAGKVALLCDLLRSPAPRLEDESLADFVAGHLGREVVDRAFAALVSGIHAGDASKLSARLSFPSLWKAEATHGSLLRGLMAQAKERRAAGAPRSRLVSFEHGLGSLVEAFVRQIPAGVIETTAEVVQLQPPKPGGAWSLKWQRDGMPRSETFSAVLCAVPAHRLAELTLAPDAAKPFAALAEIESPPVTSLFLGYRREAIKHPLDGFGCLAPPLERRALLGVLFSSSLFAGRAPEGHAALTVMVGGTQRPDLALADDAELFRAVRRELDSLLGVTGDPVVVRRTTWRHAIPQYNLGYERHLAEIERVEHTFSGLHVGGSVRDGISVPQSLEAGLRLAERALG